MKSLSWDQYYVCTLSALLFLSLNVVENGHVAISPMLLAVEIKIKSPNIDLKKMGGFSHSLKM